MKRNIAAALISAAALAVLPAAPANAAEAPELPDIAIPAFADFRMANVNGAAGVKTGGGIEAKVEITFDSPEGKALPYYSEVVRDGAMLFPIEGYSNTEDDYRDYHIRISLSDGENGFSDVLVDQKFNVPDGNDEPDSFAAVGFIFAPDNSEGAVPGTLTKTDSKKEPFAYKTFKGTADVSYYTYSGGASFLLGDVNDDGTVDGSDATMVLKEFSLGSEGKFTAAQKKAGDVNSDGTVDGSDATLILKFYGLSDSNPTWEAILANLGK